MPFPSTGEGSRVAYAFTRLVGLIIWYRARESDRVFSHGSLQGAFFFLSVDDERLDVERVSFHGPLVLLLVDGLFGLAFLLPLKPIPLIILFNFLDLRARFRSYPALYSMLMTLRFRPFTWFLLLFRDSFCSRLDFALHAIENFGSFFLSPSCFFCPRLCCLF